MSLGQGRLDPQGGLKLANGFLLIATLAGQDAKQMKTAKIIRLRSKQLPTTLFGLIEPSYLIGLDCGVEHLCEINRSRRSRHIGLDRGNCETVRQLPAPVPFPHRFVGGFKMPAKAGGVEQRMIRTFEPELAADGLEVGGVSRKAKGEILIIGDIVRDKLTDRKSVV